MGRAAGGDLALTIHIHNFPNGSEAPLSKLHVLFLALLGSLAGCFERDKPPQVVDPVETGTDTGDASG